MKTIINGKIEMLKTEISSLNLSEVNDDLVVAEVAYNELLVKRSLLLSTKKDKEDELTLLTTLLEKVEELEQELNPPIEPEIPNENEGGVEGGIGGEDEEAKEGENV